MTSTTNSETFSNTIFFRCFPYLPHHQGHECLPIFLEFLHGAQHPNRQSSIPTSIRYYPSRHHFILDRSCKDAGNHQVVNAFLFLVTKRASFLMRSPRLASRSEVQNLLGRASSEKKLHRRGRPDWQVSGLRSRGFPSLAHRFLDSLMKNHWGDCVPQ